MDAVADLMRRFREGDSQAVGELVKMFYPQLRRIAASRMHTEAPGHTWQPTALVNELYLELVKIRSLRAAEGDGEAERDAFLKLSSHLMRRLLIHHVRPLSKQVKRGEMPDQLLDESPSPQSLQEIDDMLNRLAAINAALRTVVELRVFEGLSIAETAERMNCSGMTVSRHWNFARNWLAEELPGGGEA